MPVRSPKPRTWASMAVSRPWSSSAVGRSWRARFSSSSMAWVVSRLSWATSSRCSGGTSWASASSRSRIAVSAWLTSSCRSRATRRRSSSCARSTRCDERRRSVSTRSSRRLKERPRRSISFTGSPASWTLAGAAGSMRSIRSIRCSSGAKRCWSIHRFTQKVRTSTSARIRSWPALSPPRAVEAGHEAGRDQRQGDQHHVGGHHLADQGVAAASFRGGNRMNGVCTPYRQEAPWTTLLTEAFCRAGPGGLLQQGLGSSSGAPTGRPACRSWRSLSFLK